MRFTFKALLIILLIGLSVNATAQTNRMRRADALFEAGGYFDAIDLYKRDLDKVAREDMGPYLNKIADCYRFTGNARQAELWYAKAIMRNAPDPKVFYYYAEMLKMGEKYDEAIEQYQKYKELVPNDPMANVGIESCELAQKWKASPAGYEVVNLRAINSRQSDFSPAYASDDYSILFFTSSRDDATGSNEHASTGEKFTDIFMSQRDRQGKWSKPKPLEESINTTYDEGAPSLTSDFNKLYFTRCRTSKRNKLGCEILVSERREQGWLTPDVVPISEDSMVVAHPSISDDELTLYFVSNMPGGMGGNDIWKVTRNSASDSWGEPINLGSKINTKGNEMFPYIHSDGTLYFSSDGHPGMGGLDIFRATPNDNGWEVENMRYPINSSADDFGIIFEREREAGYFSSRRRDRGSRGGDNIFLFYLPEINFNMIGKVVDDKLGKPLANASVQLVGSDGLIANSKTDADGSFRFMLNPNTDYVLIASREGYLNGKGRETTRGLSESKEFDMSISLTSTAKPIELPNIFYDFDQWELRPESMAALDKLIEVLNDNPTIVIELGAHTDSRGTLDYNYDLSQKRAQSVVNYLIERGVPTERLKAKGYAQSQPKVVDEPLAQQYSFLQVGATLNQQYIDQLVDEQQQETVHQINRRTEFKVLSTDYKAE
ncbi:MAG: OmpA family protein [Bacteroidales bacterium]|nr:OmpA family protein [Bacteroidales bacterium]MDD4673032.1 OmpA family protein [Bacteroidales bacterium]MDY0348082.1 OmpA family protein [Tenuifilaceae bacterium]